MADRRGGGGKDEGPVRRPRRQTDAPEQEQETEREEKVPEQNLYGNSFLLGAMGNQRSDGAPTDGGGVDLDTQQEYGGIEDADPVPEDAPADEQWFRPRLRRKGEEIEAEGGGEPDEPGIPPEDADWLESLQAHGEPWTDPAPQPLPVVLDGGLTPWLRGLLPIAGALPGQVAIAQALSGDRTLQDPEGRPLLGVACAAAIASSVAARAVPTAEERTRVNRGLAVSAAPAAPRDAGRTAAAIAGYERPTTLPSAPPDPWLARLVLTRFGLDQPPVPLLDDPPAPILSEPDECVDYAALLVEEIGPPPDPSEAIRGMALEACEAHAVWAVALRAGAAACAVALVHTGADEGQVAAVLQRTDESIGQAITLLQEIAAATRAGRVPIRGLRNGLTRSARLLVGAHRGAVEGLAAAGALPAQASARPEPTHPALLHAVQEGTAIPEIDAPEYPLAAHLRAGLDALGRSDWTEALALGASLRAASLELRDGAGTAAGTLLELDALARSGSTDAALVLRSEVGSALLGAGARTGLSLLARWRPPLQAVG